MVAVNIPGIVQTAVLVQASTVIEALVEISAQREGVSKRLFQGKHILRPTVIVFLNKERVFDSATPVDDNDTIDVIFAISGGDYTRYSRQIILQDIGYDGHRRIQASKVLVVGAGGLGNPATMYLSAAGIGTLGLIDGDHVEMSNLARQIAFHEGDVGTNKAVTLGKRLSSQFPDTKITVFDEHLTNDNARDIISKFDIVVNGSDNFRTRYVINQVSVELHKTWVDASVIGYDGQLVCFSPGMGCYRCLFGDLPDSGDTCESVGVLGPLCGVFGSLQAAKVLQILGNHDIRTVPSNSLFRINLMSGVADNFSWARDPDCPVCGHEQFVVSVHKSDIETEHYEFFTSLDERSMVLDIDNALGTMSMGIIPVYKVNYQRFLENPNEVIHKSSDRSSYHCIL
ncbi:ThiF family adenylyltransferase [Ferroacidibacillus organovorans]|uniref:THIF-type NAD/FAD binding fold domain-containing protein n=1 Tax=Ferroacidibacillus organovorans TaxID=1765683 RepID=A0A101XTD3_9BACL|nr:ThiF family adenylyltransferase [Ferroacidibacillus organovorans]KUO97227.1 hypothetical protein ATW55_14610 [Ferroacidibacillus organovorans]